MELLETQDPQKRKLIETSDRYKHELQKEVKTITEKTERTMKNALIIGGALALTYVLVSQISSSRKKKSRKKIKTAAIAREVDDDEDEMEEVSNEPSLISKVGTQIMNQATAILLEMAKEKLSEYLESRKQKSNENS
jgi:FtsZ-interacting cell division protein ZipA